MTTMPCDWWARLWRVCPTGSPTVVASEVVESWDDLRSAVYVEGGVSWVKVWSARRIKVCEAELAQQCDA